jgi:hypothetical protein
MPAEQSESGEAFSDQLSLNGDETSIYEAIATLEYLGRPAGATEIISATGLRESVVGESLHAMVGRGVLRELDEDGRAVYAPAYRGWSTAPEQSAGPQR